VAVVLVIGYIALTYIDRWAGPAKMTHSGAVPEALDAATSSALSSHAPSPVPQPTPAVSVPPEIKLASDRGVEQQAMAYAKTRQRLAVDQADEAIRLADECKGEIAAFDAVVQPLLRGDDGKKVAGAPAQVARFRTVFGKDRPAKEVVERGRRVAESLIAPLRASLDNPNDGSNPGVEIWTELDRLRAELTSAKRAWAQDRRTIEAIVADARRGTQPPAARTLEEAVRAEAEAEALTLATALEKERSRVRAEENAKLLKEAGELERKIEEAKREKLRAAKTAEAKRIEMDAESTAQKAKEAVALEKAKAERDRLVKKANTAEVKQALAPFLTPGYHQPYRHSAGGGLVMERSVKKEPMSFSRLQAFGALDKKVEGLQALANVAGNKEDDTRPRWGYGFYAGWWTSSQQETIQKAQDLLNELGPVMVEEGLLAK
jgi:hypothetical protein